jgi:hypothetical protein
VDDGFDIAHGGTQTARIGEGDHGYFDGYTFGQTRRLCRWANECAQGIPDGRELTHEGASDESGGAGYEDHGWDYTGRLVLKKAFTTEVTKSTEIS